MGYKTVNGSSEAEFTEKKSRFIGYIRHTATERQALDFLSEIRAMHRKATHNCYAYIIRENNISRHSDDGEPQGTAGVPIYEVLKKEGLTDVTVVVTRYFGGILLGAGGLVRAYSKAAKEAVGVSEILDMREAARLELKLSYSLYGRIGRVISENDARVENEEFAEGVTVTLCAEKQHEKKLTEALTDACDGEIIINKIADIEYNFG